MDKYDNWKNIALFNTKTGEILEGGIPIYVGTKVKWRENWFMGIQEAFGALARDKEIAGRARRILDYLFSKLGFENYICVTQQEISRELDIGKEHVSREIKKLVSKGIILPGPKLGRTSTYRLNSEYGWRGSVKNLSKDRQNTHLKVVK